MVKNKIAHEFYPGTAPSNNSNNPPTNWVENQLAQPQTLPAVNVERNPDDKGVVEQVAPSYQSGSTGLAPIKAMQNELIALAQAVTSQINLKNLQSTDPREQSQAAGRNSFNDFITKNYLRKSEVPGVEFDPDPSKYQMSEKSPSTPTRMNVVMDTMRRIGGGGQEFAVDGKWGPKTNAALKNAYALADSLLNLASDFGLKIQAYTSKQLEELRSLIPDQPNDFSMGEKLEVAPKLTGQIKNIIRMYNEIKSGILEKPAYKAYIEADKPFVSYQKKGAQITDEQIATLNSKFKNLRINVISPDQTKTEVKPINISDLASLSALQMWQKENAPRMTLSQIISQLQKNMNQPQVNMDLK